MWLLESFFNKALCKINDEKYFTYQSVERFKTDYLKNSKESQNADFFQEFWIKKYHLKMNLRIYECLCPANEQILIDCKNLKHLGFIYDFYIRNGCIKIIINEGDNPKKIKHK